MKCLRCENVEMNVEMRGKGELVEEVEVDSCPSCGALWLDASELHKLDDNIFVDIEEIAFTDVNPSNEDKALNCPRCVTSMNKVRPKDFDEVVLDTCPKCKGFWLDKGELEKVKSVSDRALVSSIFD